MRGLGETVESGAVVVLGEDGIEKFSDTVTSWAGFGHVSSMNGARASSPDRSCSKFRHQWGVAERSRPLAAQAEEGTARIWLYAEVLGGDAGNR